MRTGAWLGFFGEASDEESSADRSRASHENSAGAGRNAPPDEEDWAERIMQTLVNREDLPHEWFTETGAIRLERQRRG